ncbi:MAG: DUF928 domain-containing protein [Leptolyngbyaceae cyanobacterium bins.349]|nr:DUF928 domain-containing protein [Leptolyngbyaceae cyanobacterium bins.349]
MIQLLPTVQKVTLLATSVLSLTFMVASFARADFVGAPTQPTTKTGSTGTRGYTPPNPSRPSRGTGSTGTRGGCEDASQASSTANLLTLAPQQHIGRTSSSHPTLVWYVPGQQAGAIELSLFEYGANGRGKRMQTFELPGTPGIMQWTLPQSQPGLAAGQTYVWQVALICNRNRPSQNQWTEAVIEVATVPPNLTAILKQTTDPLKRATAYAEAGFWYDALAETFKTPTARSLRLTLLEQLSQLESPEQQAQLQAIVANER